MRQLEGLPKATPWRSDRSLPCLRHSRWLRRPEWAGRIIRSRPGVVLPIVVRRLPSVNWAPPALRTHACCVTIAARSDLAIIVPTVVVRTSDNADDRVAALLTGGTSTARLVAELAVALNLSSVELEESLTRLESRGAVLVVDHPPPDRHLDRADLRVVAWVGSESPRPAAEAHALAAAERTWNGWLATFLATHRCG